jgi:hypothetical protein
MHPRTTSALTIQAIYFPQTLLFSGARCARFQTKIFSEKSKARV